MPQERLLINKIKISVGPDGNILCHEKIGLGERIVKTGDTVIYYDPNEKRVIGFEIPDKKPNS